jgi:hypothetical protein
MVLEARPQRGQPETPQSSPFCLKASLKATRWPSRSVSHSTPSQSHSSACGSDMLLVASLPARQMPGEVNVWCRQGNCELHTPTVHAVQPGPWPWPCLPCRPDPCSCLTAQRHMSHAPGHEVQPGQPVPRAHRSCAGCRPPPHAPGPVAASCSAGEATVAAAANEVLHKHSLCAALEELSRRCMM